MPWHSPCALSSLIFDLSKTNALPFRNLSIPLEVFRLLSHRPASFSVSASLRRPVPCFTRFRFSSLRYEVFKVRIRGMYLLPNLSFQRCSSGGSLAGRLAHGEPSKRYMREKAGCAPFLTACRSFAGFARRAPLSLCALRIFVRFRSAFEAFASPVFGDDRPGIAMRHCLLAFLPRKEVIQPHLPIRLPCYDFTPVI